MWERLRRAAREPSPVGPFAGPEPTWQWPLRLHGRTPTGIDLVLRPLALEDEQTFGSVRRSNAAWLEPWDATSPDPDAPGRTFTDLVAQYEADGRYGRALPLVIEVGGRLVGQMSMGSIVLGSFRSCFAGYWVSRSVAGQLVTPTALAVAGDHLLQTVGLHRIEVNIRPENEASLAVVRKLGFRPEGLRPRYLHIAGEWRDHLSFALTTEDLAGETLRDRLERLQRPGTAGATRSDHPNHSSQQSLPRHTEGGPASDGDAHLRS